MFPPGIRGAALSKTAWARHPSRATKARLVTRSTRAFSSAEWAKNANAGPMTPGPRRETSRLRRATPLTQPIDSTPAGRSIREMLPQADDREILVSAGRPSRSRMVGFRSCRSNRVVA